MSALALLQNCDFLNMHNVGPPRGFGEYLLLGNKGTKGRKNWENTGRKAYFREQGIPKSKKYVKGTREHKALR